MQPVPKHGRGVQNPSVFHQICSKLCERQHFAMKSETVQLFAFACFRFVHASSFQDQRLFWTGTGKPQLFWGNSTSLQGKCGSSNFKTLHRYVSHYRLSDSFLLTRLPGATIYNGIYRLQPCKICPCSILCTCKQQSHRPTCSRYIVAGKEPRKRKVASSPARFERSSFEAVRGKQKPVVSLQCSTYINQLLQSSHKKQLG